MAKILYVQQNEKVAEQFRTYLKDSEHDFLVAYSGEEAIEIISAEKIVLLLIDINIPDMRLRKLVEMTKKISPETILNVCVDVLDPLLVTKLSNRYGIHKIYVAPWDIENIISEMEDSIEMAFIDSEMNSQEHRIVNDKADLETTITSLMSTLKKQQFSHKKLSVVYRSFMKAVREKYEGNISKDKLLIIDDIYKEMLKNQTTGSFDVGKFENDIKSDLLALKSKGNNGITIGRVVSCLFGGITKTSAENIRFAIWLVARATLTICKEFEYSVTSHFITTETAQFDFCIVPKGGMSVVELNANKEKKADFFNFITLLLKRISEEFALEINEKANKVVISLKFELEED